MTATPSASPQESPPRCSRRGWLAVLSALLALLAGTVWLLGSEGGMRVICRMIEGLTAGQLTLIEPTGTLRGPLSLQSLRWRDETLDIQVQELEVDWYPAELLRGRLAVGLVKVTSLRVANLSSSEATRLPDNLVWPLSVEVGQLSVGRFEVGEHAHPDGKSVTIAEAVEAQLSSDGLLHRLLHLRARIGGLRVVAEASLEAKPPFALTAKAGIEGDAAGRALAFDLTAEGRLEDFALQGLARAGVTPAGEHFAGEIAARITPFSPQPVLGAVIQLSAVDPSAWIDGAPQAVLDLRAELQPQGNASAGLSGRLTVLNRSPGPVDRQRLPVASLQADLALGENGWRLANLDAHVSGGGRLQGGGCLHADELALRLAVTSLDASALHSSLRRTQLAGPLLATLGLNSQRLETELRDAQFSIHSKLAIDPDEIVFETLQLLADDARLVARGQVARSESGGFAVRGTLQNFDPSRFARLPAARLNAEFAVQGRRHPQLALALSFQLQNSRFGKEALLAGNGEIDLVGQRLRRADVELTAAGNRLSAKGAFGAAGDQLTVLVAAPRLDPLGITGELNGRFVLSGSMQVPEVSADLQSAHLALPGFGQLRGLTFSARLGNGSQGELSGMLRLVGLDLSNGERALHDVMIDAEGVRSQHRLHAQLSLPVQGHRRDLRLLLAGGFVAQPAGMTWAGTLNELTLSSLVDKHKPFLRLAAALPLQLASGSYRAGPGEFIGTGWSLQLDRLRYQQSHWQSIGGLRALPVGLVLAEFPEWSEALAVRGNGEPLRLNGAWEIGADDAAGSSRTTLPVARIRLWRDRGDLAIGNLPLGLEEGTMSLLANGGRCQGQIKLRGQRLGEIAVDFSAASSPDAWLDRQAPWRGELRLNAPDLTWAGPLVGDGWQLGGRLSGSMLLAGTPAQPRLNGEWRGDGLVVRALDQGVRLERGKLLLQLRSDAATDVRLLLRELSFESELQPLPRALLLDSRIDAGKLRAGPGRIEASGELRPGHSEGVLQLRAERLGVLQRPDQWVLVSGDAELKLGERMLDVIGRLQLDAAYWELARSGTPQLSDDVLIKRTDSGQAKASVPARLLSLNLEADLGRHFHFRGAGVESRLVGALKVHSEGSGVPRAIGSIRTEAGRFDAYGQKLDIERGILNFQGLLDNPGLNIRAMRSNLPVEAGVEVTGTAKRPLVRLVSDPDVPDAEKLSWLVLGHAPDQQRGQDTSVLLAAAQTILGGQDGGPLKAVQRGLGIDEFGISRGRLDGSGQRQTSRIASKTGFGASDTTTEQIVSVGKRLSSNMLISYEQSLTTAGSIVKLTVNLSRHFSFAGYTGSATGMDLLWSYRFGADGKVASETRESPFTSSQERVGR
ncbi:MAG TPA: translocation/assembly module TamB domain-containing protein [Accumulibacter sp.]|uniref:translocation/assembly module TamB domain-containing protein n=1 Tax=Accumulibacter sp. TaxID=2053492 RepID=UPI002582BD6F|nr:translocation/assembly module TamB domain-containing protein [Accumulibacter sp.]MCC2867910.1 translocation/assembly module TamB domain-containing protein [Candidatus Accumulibacter phosphatis]MCM8581266.1 translocation/assembly module TamB domain-containing protein [Accumulibacter sp.]HMW57149.1 translocation/assembly module TamB domain-containing protein [Accumulibacter sp.]HNF92470.1 translocation/assembly module TamB domain-containing protein [Accumulibacter sp.]